MYLTLKNDFESSLVPQVTYHLEGEKVCCSVCCSVCAAVCCGVLQCVLQCMCCSVLRCVAVYLTLKSDFGSSRVPQVTCRLEGEIVCCSVLQCVAVCCSVLQCTCAASDVSS